MIRVYIATGLDNMAEHNLLRDELAKLDVHLTYDWTVHGPVWRDGLDRIKEVSQLELDGVRHADIVVVIRTTVGQGRGTHVELGAALAYGLPVVIVSRSPRDDFGAVSSTCAFYHHPLVVQYSDYGWGYDVLAAEIKEMALAVRSMPRMNTSAIAFKTGKELIVEGKCKRTYCHNKVVSPEHLGLCFPCFDSEHPRL